MDPKNFTRPADASGRQHPQQEMFRDLEATELYCPRCKQAVPVRKRLLLILPEGDKYEYLCAFCSASIGTKIDRNRESLSIIV